MLRRHVTACLLQLGRFQRRQQVGKGVAERQGTQIELCPLLGCLQVTALLAH
jgi:hypothetical protein